MRDEGDTIGERCEVVDELSGLVCSLVSASELPPMLQALLSGQPIHGPRVYT